MEEFFERYLKNTKKQKEKKRKIDNTLPAIMELFVVVYEKGNGIKRENQKEERRKKK